MQNLENYAGAIALRISDEWHGQSDFPEDAILLRKVLQKVLVDNPEECKKLIGTGIIEEDYFEDLS